MPEPGARLALPEFTRAMRAFASVTSLGAPFHDTLFTPLLAARREAAEAHGVDGQLSAFEAVALQAVLVGAIESVAAECWPKSVADRRALTAQLLDLAAPIFSALNESAARAAELRNAFGAELESGWSRWVLALQTVFTEWDRFWGAAAPLVVPLAKAKRGRKRGAK